MWSLILLPVAWLIQNTLHEASHLLVGWWREGRKPIALIPYPHMCQGVFFFARCEYGPLTKQDSRGLMDIAPFWAGLVWFSIHTLVALVTWTPWTLPFALAGLVDALFFWWGYFWGSSTCDGKSYKRRVG